MNIMIETTGPSISSGLLQIPFSVRGDGVGPYGTEVIVSMSLTATQINAAIIAEADAIMEANSHTMDPGDSRVIFGGAS